MKKSRISGLLTVLLIFLIAPSLCYGDPGITERAGEKVPLDAAFFDESGNNVTLGSIIDRPVVLSFAYFNCKDICNTTLSNISDLLNRMGPAPGEDFIVLTVSFDETDGPIDAAHKKRNYMKAAGRPMPEGAWRFLTGKSPSIEALTKATGFGFQKKEKWFDHPAALAVLSSDGRIVRYVYGNSYLPADIEMALLEAREGRIVASVKKALIFCFSDEPGGRTYVKGVLRAVGVTTLIFAAGFLIYLTASRRPGKKDP